MFARIKKSGKYQYLQIVENRREKGKTRQRVLVTLGRIDKLNASGSIDQIIRSLSKYSDQVLMILTQEGGITADSKRIGPAIIFERLWNELGIKKVINELLKKRKFEFDVERAIFVTVLHRLFASGSDRACDKWKREYVVDGADELALHHFYRAMAFLGAETEDQTDATPFSPRCVKDLIEEKMFAQRRNLFSGLDLVFFDTTSIYFEGKGGRTIGQHGHSKDHRPDLKQMVVGAVLDDNGHPICCEMWPGNTADVKTLIPVAQRLKRRFNIKKFCIVADRGMISAGTIEELEKDELNLPYILGVRMRQVKEVRQDVLSRGGRFQEVYPEGVNSKDPSPLKVKEVWEKGTRYIVCLNTRQARKDAADRQAILDSLEGRLKQGPKSMIGNKGYRKYLKVSKDTIEIDRDKVEQEARFDGKWVLRTNTDLSSSEVALKYKELWQVEHVFRDIKSVLETRPIYHKCDETIRGHVFCSFLALVLRKELDRRLEAAGCCFEWEDIKQDLEALQETVIDDKGKRVAVRTHCNGICGKVFQAVKVAVPPVVRLV